jgi:hypothetical protein
VAPSIWNRRRLQCRRQARGGSITTA